MLNFRIPILMYHSIESMPKDTIMRSLHVPPKRFKYQMWLLKKLGYKGLSVSKLKPYLDGKKHGKVVGITFDDGYQNNLINALPILTKYNFSATCYIVSGNIGETNTWDLKKNITQRPLMTKKEISEWISMGMEIGAHTATHVDLTETSEQLVKEEITKCKEQLENLFDIEIKDFCYPFGRYDQKACEIVKGAGFYSATSMNRGRVSPTSNRYQLPRIPINHRTMPHLFLLKIMTKYEDRK